MALNREEKRKPREVGGVSDEDQPLSRRTTDTKPAAKCEERTSAWSSRKSGPSREGGLAHPQGRCMNYSLIVAVTLVLDGTVLIFGLELGLQAKPFSDSSTSNELNHK